MPLIAVANLKGGSGKSTLPACLNRTFNNGIGMVVAPGEAAAVAESLRQAGESVREIGRIGPRGEDAAVTVG